MLASNSPAWEILTWPFSKYLYQKYLDIFWDVLPEVRDTR